MMVRRYPVLLGGGVLLRGLSAGVVVVSMGLAASACGTSGNGVASLPASQILSKAKAAVQAAKTVRIVGQFKSSGQTVGLDLDFKPGTGTVANLTLSGAKVNVVAIGQTVYFKGDSLFWSQIAAQQPGGSSAGKAFVALAAGRWFKVSKSATGSQIPGFSQLAQFTSLSTFVNQVFSPASTNGAKNGGAATVDGQATVKLIGAQGGDLYVATSGTPYPVELTSPSATAGTLNFTYNVPVTVTAPPGAVNLSSLLPKG